MVIIHNRKPNPEITTFLFSLEYLSADATSLQCRCNISSFNADTAVKFKRLWYEDIVHFSTLKVEAILNIKAPKTRKELRQFIGIVNYYRDMWFCRSELLAPLTSLTSSKVKFDWLPSHQQALIKSKMLLNLSFCYHTQTLKNHSTSTLMPLTISWVRLLCKIKSLWLFIRVNLTLPKEDIPPLSVSCYLPLKPARNIKISC